MENVGTQDTSKRDKRQHHRVPYVGPIRISWDDDQGITRFAHSKCINISEGGLRIQVGESIPLRSYISLRADRIAFSGSATVRNIAWHGCKYILGLNLSQNQSPAALALLPGA